MPLLVGVLGPRPRPRHQGVRKAPGPCLSVPASRREAIPRTAFPWWWAQPPEARGWAEAAHMIGCQAPTKPELEVILWES